MVRKIGLFLLAFAGVCASTVLASAQTTSSPTEAMQAASSPAAYVYISTYMQSAGNFQINGYSAVANGALTPIPGSPFPDSVNQMAVNGSWLFGSEQTSAGDTGNVNSYSIASNGALTLKQQTFINDSGGGPTSLLLDHTGSSLYVDYYNLNNDCLSYTIDQSSGALTYLNTLFGGPGTGCPTSFTANNQFLYSASCYHFTPIIYGDERNSDGSLSNLAIQPALPTPPVGTGYCPYLAAADTSNHIAVAVTPMEGGFGNTDGPTQLAVYTVDDSGNLTTNSTDQNMPKTGVVPQSGGTYFVTDYAMSPSGKLLAVAGPLGLQVFHFNGATPITNYTKLLTNDYINEVVWDNANHLYAISASTRKLYVFTVTPTGVSQAPGSPHSIPGMSSIIVLPKS